MSDTPETGSLHYGWLDPEQEDALLRFYRRAFPTNGRVVELYLWRRDAGDALETPRAFVAWDGQEIVGSLTAFPERLALGGCTIRAAWQGDTFVDPRYRGKGMGRQLSQGASTEWEVSLAKGTSDAMYGLRKKIGYGDIPNSHILALPLRPLAPGLGAAKSAAHAVAFSLGWMRRMVGGRWDTADAALSLRWIPQWPSGVTTMLAQRRKEGLVIPHRTAPYLTWRYTTCPGKEYEFLVTDREDREGVLVFSDGDRQHPAWIVDIMARPDDHAVFRQLILAAIQKSSTQGASVLKTFCTDPQVRKHLKGFGFVDTASTPRFTFLARDPALHATLGALPWHVWHGDSDNELYSR